MESVISIKDLSKSFGDNKAVDQLELEVFKGDVFGFLGPNGAGKSTTIRMLLTLIEPDAGTIRIFNSDLKTERKNILRRIGCIVEKPDFYTFLSAAKNLEVLSMYNGIAITKKQIEEMLLELAEQLSAHLGKELVKICIENWMLLPDLAAENERREDDAAPIEEMNVQLGPNAREIRDGHDARLRRELANANNAANKISDLVDRRQRIARL